MTPYARRLAELLAYNPGLRLDVASRLARHPEDGEGEMPDDWYLQEASSVLASESADRLVLRLQRESAHMKKREFWADRLQMLQELADDTSVHAVHREHAHALLASVEETRKKKEPPTLADVVRIERALFRVRIGADPGSYTMTDVSEMLDVDRAARGLERTIQRDAIAAWMADPANKDNARRQYAAVRRGLQAKHAKRDYLCLHEAEMLGTRPA